MRFVLWVLNLFPYRVYEEGGEEAHRLGMLVSGISQWGSDLSLRTLWTGCDGITFLCVLEVLFWLTPLPRMSYRSPSGARHIAKALEDFLGILVILLEMRGGG